MKVLVVDDHPRMREVLGEVLRDACSYETLEAANAEVALRVNQEQRPDVAVLDMRLPGMDGLELAHRLHKSHPDLPIIICTADPQTAAGRNADGLTICDKSEMPESIIEAIAAVAPV